MQKLTCTWAGMFDFGPVLWYTPDIPRTITWYMGYPLVSAPQLQLDGALLEPGRDYGITTGTILEQILQGQELGLGQQPAAAGTYGPAFWLIRVDGLKNSHNRRYGTPIWYCGNKHYFLDDWLDVSDTYPNPCIGLRMWLDPRYWTPPHWVTIQRGQPYDK